MEKRDQQHKNLGTSKSEDSRFAGSKDQQFAGGRTEKSSQYEEDDMDSDLDESEIDSPSRKNESRREDISTPRKNAPTAPKR